MLLQDTPFPNLLNFFSNVIPTDEISLTGLIPHGKSLLKKAQSERK